MAVSWVLRPSDAQDDEQNQTDQADNKVTASEHVKDEDFKKETTPAKKEQGNESKKKRESPENDEEPDQQPTESSPEDTTRKRDRKEGRRDGRRSRDGKRREGRTKDRSKNKERKKGRERPQDFSVNVARDKRSAKKVLQLPMTHPRSFLKNRAAPGVRPAVAMVSANFARRFVDSPLSHHPEAKLYKHKMEKGKMKNNDAL